MRSHDKRALCAEVCHVYFSCTVAIQLLIFSSHVRMLIYLPALNLKLSVALSTPIIANYLLQPEAMCRLASSNQTLLFSRQGCEVHQKQHSNSLNIPSCHCIWVKVTVLCQALGRGGGLRFQVLASFYLWNGCFTAFFCYVLSLLLYVHLCGPKLADALHKE